MNLDLKVDRIMGVKSKALYAFEQRVIYFDDDLELMDIIQISSEEGLLSDSDSNSLFKELNPEIHNHIKRRNGNPAKNINSRRQVVAHLKKTLCSAYVKDLYEEFSGYLRNLLLNVAMECNRQSSVVNIEGIIGKTLKTSFTAEQLLHCGSWYRVVDLIVNTLFQSLENERSTKALVKQVSKKLNIDISDELIDVVMPYLDIRHVLVHADGKPNREFKQQYPAFNFDCDSKKRIKLTFTFCKEMRNGVFNLAREIDRQIIEKNILSEDYLYIPKSINSE